MGPLLGFLAWWPLVQELEVRTALAAMIGEADRRVEELRRLQFMIQEQTL